MLYFLGLTLMVVGGVMLFPLPIASLTGEYFLIPYFLIPSAIAFLLGFLFFKFFEEEELSYGEAMVLAAISFLLISLFGSFPFVMGAGLDPISAYFESMSGFTTTGLTMFEMPGPGTIDAPQTILFWRSLSQWVGGLGIMILFLSTVLGAGRISKRLFSAEGGGGRIGPANRRGPEVTIRAMAKSTWKIYTLFTLVAALIFWLVGMPAFESINHAMTALSTGGFSVTSDSFASYSNLILVVGLFPMIAGAISFTTHIRVTSGDLKALIKSNEVKLMLFLIVLSTVLLSWNLGWADALFSSITAQTTTGFSSVGEAGLINGPGWGPLQKSVIVLQMVIGAGFGSTGGGIKLIRTIVLGTAVYWLVKRAVLPERAVVPLTIGKETLSEETVLQIAVFGFSFILLLVAGSMITMAAMPQYSAIDCVFDSVSAQGTVGLSAGVTGYGMPVVVKLLFIIQMWVGRLEVIPVFTLLGYLFHKTPSRGKPI
ncbi:hypothetical protein AKJ56_00815 [candidate division MSBL1 archaeon SCGC-AAA382N08]|uniref:Cation transporter n=1 Tax=candidate division MSBL1 archaeon SCGC-AAA382N08 TaxID=1698285 RepID=A0A133VQA7_9EURY|nr:hypothetical protein AKJ56_00815 [candidate division MSBL1 archaeon SCGC-AAA382N08]